MRECAAGARPCQVVIAFDIHIMQAASSRLSSRGSSIGDLGSDRLGSATRGGEYCQAMAKAIPRSLRG
jgi:hypothetical protein